MREKTPEGPEDKLSLREYAEHVGRHRPVAWTDDVPWSLSGRVLFPLVMPHHPPQIPAADVRAAMRKTGAWVAMWHDAWNVTETEWWWFCANDPNYGLDYLSKKNRQKVRAGLRRCDVRRVDSEWLAFSGYEVYQAAFSHYRDQTDPFTPEAFTREIEETAEYRGREFWGAFSQGSLIAFASCIVIEDAVQISWFKSDPSSYSLLPNNALIFTLTQHYLVERGLQYVTGGNRAISLNTDIGIFLERMGFQKVYCRLRLEMHPAVRFLIHSPIAWLIRSRLCERLFPRVPRLVRSALEAERIARAS